MSSVNDNEFARLLATDRARSSPTLRGARVLGRDGRLTVERSVFTHIESGARLVIVGITPGNTQQASAERALGEALRAGLPYAEAARRAKFAGGFCGPMRGRLVAMLDHVGAQAALGLDTCARLFDPGLRGVAHFTSALRHPVFVDGRNYTGYAPDMLRTPLLRRMVETLLAEEAEALPDAFWQPLGPKAAEALHHLARSGLLDLRCILPPVPHPAGANNERSGFFLGRIPRERLSHQVVPGPIEEARAALRERYARMAAGRAGEG